MEYSRIDQFCLAWGLGRTTVNALIARGDLRAIKIGRRTLIDCRAAREYFASRPAADIKVPSAVKAMAA